MRCCRTVRQVTSPTVIVTARATGLVLVLAFLTAFVVGRADGASQSWSAYLAPASACSEAGNANAPARVQARTVTCLLNFARARGDRAPLLRRTALRKAAALKGRGVASCKQFSHTPCGSQLTSAVRASGYRYASFGENLFIGSWGYVTPRDVVGAWLRSPGHRAILLNPAFRHVGAAPVRAPGLLGDANAVVWTATFASPR